MNNFMNNFLRKYYADIGTVVAVGDGIASIIGLDNVANGEMISFCGLDQKFGLILNLDEDRVSAVVLGKDNDIRPGQYVSREYELMSVPIGASLLGRVVDALGAPIDDKGSVAL
jgi:F-type H+-transporting ATPase subunit alpha